MPQEWDEKGNPIAAQEWDEKGNPISSPHQEKTDATYHSNPSFSNYAGPQAAERTTHLTPQQQSKQDTVAPAKGQEIPAPVRAAIEWGPLAGEAVEAQAAGRLIPFAKRAATGLVGAVGGSTLGGWAGGHLAGKTGAEVGGVLGGVGGGLAGAGAFGEDARQIGNPRRLPFIGKQLPDLLPGEAPPPKIGKSLTMPVERPQLPPTSIPQAPRVSQTPLQEFAARQSAQLPQAPKPLLDPLRPLIGSPEDWNAYDQKKAILKAEGSDAGTYHAARGSAKNPVNLQERINKRFQQ